MTRAPIVAAVLLVCTVALPSRAYGQSATQGGSANDQTVRVRDLPTGASALPIMEAICPGHTKMVQGEKGRIPACTKCPKEADAQNPQLRAARIVQIGDDYAVVSTLGCAGGFNFRDSTVVLKKRGKSGWKMVSYTPQRNTEDCDWLPVEPPVALCTHTEAGQGSAETSVYSVSFHDGTLNPGPLTSLVDKEGACRYVGDFSAKLDDTVFENVDGDGEQELVLLITKKTGTKTGKKRPEGTDPCDDLDTGVIKVEETQEAKFFRLDGGKFKPVDIKKAAVENKKVRRYVE